MNTSQLALVRCRAGAGDCVLVDARAARPGVRIWIEDRGRWLPGLIVHRGRKEATVMIGRQASRAVYQRRAYRELRRRIVKPRLEVIVRAGNSQRNLRGL